jgi:hypothetical protein
VSRLAASNFRNFIAERIGKADRVKALDRDRNALKNYYYYYYYQQSWCIAIKNTASRQT